MTTTTSTSSAGLGVDAADLELVEFNTRRVFLFDTYADEMETTNLAADPDRLYHARILRMHARACRELAASDARMVVAGTGTGSAQASLGGHEEGE